MDNTTKFLKDLSTEIETSKAYLNDSIKSTQKAIFLSLMGPKSESGTPKITGHLRSNWVASVDSTFSGVIGSRESVDTSVRDSAFRQLLSTDDIFNKSNVYFTNNVHYGPSVNDGIDQPRQAFKETAIERGNNHLDRLK